MSVREIPKECQFWPTDFTPTQDSELIAHCYNQGFAGAWRDQDADALMHAQVEADGGQAYASGITSLVSGAGKLSLLFPIMEKVFPGCLPGPAQQRGDCVAHGSKNAALASLAVEIELGKPDEITGLSEGLPDVSSEGIKQGVLSSEYLYWWRGYNGDGWSCSAAASMIRKEGMLLRRKYPELELDLTRYSGGLAGKYGSRQPPENIAATGRINVVRTTTEAQSQDEVRDLIASGYGISSCGSEGFSDTRDENGVSSRKGSWAHAMAYLGFDDRDVIKAKYNGPLVLVCNSWGTWNKGPTQILGTSLQIPRGCFWARWADVQRREAIAYSSVAGWPAKKLPDYGFSILG